MEDFTAAGLGGEGRSSKPQRLLYSLQWRHNATPPDLHLQLVRDPQLWFDFVATMLLGALRQGAPEAIDWAAMGNIAPLIDAFEAARDSGTFERRH